MQYTNCLNGTVNAACQAAFLGIHLTAGSSAYFEVYNIDSFIPIRYIHRMIRGPGYGLQITI